MIKFNTFFNKFKNTFILYESERTFGKGKQIQLQSLNEFKPKHLGEAIHGRACVLAHRLLQHPVTGDHLPIFLVFKLNKTSENESINGGLM